AAEGLPQVVVTPPPDVEAWEEAARAVFPDDHEITESIHGHGRVARVFAAVLDDDLREGAPELAEPRGADVAVGGGEMALIDGHREAVGRAGVVRVELVESARLGRVTDEELGADRQEPAVLEDLQAEAAAAAPRGRPGLGLEQTIEPGQSHHKKPPGKDRTQRPP